MAKKKWDAMTGEEKTKAQAIELMMIEQGKFKKKKERQRQGGEKEVRKWGEMTGEEKTAQQAAELFLFEQKNPRQTTAFFEGLEKACDDIWNKMSGMEKTKHQEIDLLMAEQGKLSKANKKKAKITDNSTDMEKELVRARAELFEKSQEARKKALEERMKREGMQKGVEAGREFTPIELVRAASVLHHDDGQTPLQQKKSVKLYVVKHETEAEKALRRGAKVDAGADVREQKEKDLEISKLQGAIMDAFAHGYDIDYQ